MGVDLGQAQDHATVVVLQRLELVFPNQHDSVTSLRRQSTVILVRYAERIPLGPSVAADIAVLAARPAMQNVAHIVVGAMGLAAPVVHLVRATAGLRNYVVPVVIAHGGQKSERDGQIYLPKRDLMSGLRVAFEAQSIAIATGLEATAQLTEELIELRLGRSQFGTERLRGKHNDDLATTLALAWWQAARDARCT